jgi:rhodanese-related sulfurtransferase
MSIKGYLDARHLIDCAALSAFRDDVTILDWRPADDYVPGRIEVSKHLDLYQISLTNSAPGPLEAFLSMFPGLFGSRVVSRERPVVVYDH